MATFEDARLLAERYAASDSLRTGQPWRGYVEEFADGWFIWTVPPPDSRPDIGTGNKTVLDRETGGLSHWPAMPTEAVAAMYERARTAGSSPAAPGRLVPTPTMLARVTSPEGQVIEASGATGEAEPDHHRLVAAWLAGQPTGQLVRGTARHAELSVLSQWLMHLDAVHAEAGLALLDLDAAKVRLGQCEGSVLAIRPDDDHARPVRPCDSCLRAWVHFGLYDETALAFVEPYRPESAVAPPDPYRFPPQVAATLVDGGWGRVRTRANGQPFDPQRWGEIAVEMLSEKPGRRYRIPAFDAARAAIARYPVLTAQLRGPGRDCWVRPFTLAVKEQLAGYGDVLGDFAQVIGAGLFPLGEEEGGGLIAVDERGRIFVLDQAGEWYYGENIDAALTALLEGHEPTRLR